ncbi:MAG: acetamidase/formamidase family protein [Treponema sp.]|nr:acetamidase/formamidase family protein [Treponema sp.]
MKRALRTQLVYEHSAENKPQFYVKSGEVFEAETELCSGDWLKSIDTVWSHDKEKGGNPVVVVGVEGAVPGDCIKVYIDKIVPDKLGYTGFVNREHKLANKIIDRDWGNNMRIVSIENGFVHFSPSLRIPVKPMIGTLGTAPPGSAIKNVSGGRHGGNMDAQEVCPGSVITLPVRTPGALLHIGDVHAIQGDGEINGAGGIECRALVTLRAEIVKQPAHYGCVRAEDRDFLSVIACEGDMETCCVTAARELLYWICQDYGMDEKDAYLLLGQVMEMRVTQLVNPTRTIVAKINKSYLILR